MAKDEILRLKQITGLIALFSNVDFSLAWVPEEDDFVPDEDKTETALI